MDDRTERGGDNAPSRSAPSAPNLDEQLRDRREGTSSDAYSPADRSSSSKPALTDREQKERWPVG